MFRPSALLPVAAAVVSSQGRALHLQSLNFVLRATRCVSPAPRASMASFASCVERPRRSMIVASPRVARALSALRKL
eukprot:2892091-Alexandrium_andersonii.AAC.1